MTDNVQEQLIEDYITAARDVIFTQASIAFESVYNIPLIFGPSSIEGNTRVSRQDNEPLTSDQAAWLNGFLLGNICDRREWLTEGKPSLTTLADRRLMETPGAGAGAGRQEVEGQDERD